MIAFWALGGNIIIIKYAHKKCDLDVSEYFRFAVLPVVFIIVVMLVMGYTVQLIIDSTSIYRMILTLCITTMTFGLSSYYIGLNDRERNSVKCALSSRIKHLKNG